MPPNHIEIKICGITTHEALSAALDENADYVGLVFYPPSPRNIDLKTAASLSEASRNQAKTVALFVNPTDDQLSAVIGSVDPDLIQLHGDEDAARLIEIKQRFNRPIIKAIPISSSSDIVSAKRHERAADILLFDAKPASDDPTALPGGNGVAFDWQTIENFGESAQFMLSGGLNPDNVVEAIQKTGARAVDVSSGVERTRGQKDPELIHRFIKTVRAYEADRE